MSAADLRRDVEEQIASGEIPAEWLEPHVAHEARAFLAWHRAHSAGFGGAQILTGRMLSTVDAWAELRTIAQRGVDARRSCVWDGPKVDAALSIRVRGEGYEERVVRVEVMPVDQILALLVRRAEAQS